MTLKEWLNTNGVTATDFARRIGKTPATVSRLLRGKQWLDRETAVAIKRETKGQVTADDFSEAA
jgi:3,4-dihydroxy 2-butanone 4-phosphate synthase/GTP cyclohydrolase II